MNRLEWQDDAYFFCSRCGDELEFEEDDGLCDSCRLDDEDLDHEYEADDPAAGPAVST